MDITKVKADLANVTTAITKLVTDTAMNAAKNPAGVKGIGALVKANEKIAQAVEQLEVAVEKATPKVKEEKAPADKKK